MDDIAGQFAEHGYVVLPRAVEPTALDELRRRLLTLVERVCGRSFATPHSPEFASFMNEHKDVQTRVYDEIRGPAWLTDFARAPVIIKTIGQLLGGSIGLLRKIPFRIDAPLETAQFAVWHQNQFYVRGNLDTVTAWIPLQDTAYVHGCLSVMPGSHLLGPLRHETKVLGKRDCPAGIFDREIRLVEMKEGDALLFHSCLLHSSGLNVSDVVRFSVQARYTLTNQPTDPGMGGIVPL